jgi:hypothetical protein
MKYSPGSDQPGNCMQILRDLLSHTTLEAPDYADLVTGSCVVFATRNCVPHQVHNGTAYIAPSYKHAIMNAREDCGLNKHPKRIRALRSPSLLRVGCLSLVQEDYNHWKISRCRSDGVIVHRSKDLHQACVSTFRRPSSKGVPITILAKTQHKKKGRVPCHGQKPGHRNREIRQCRHIR